MRAGDEPRRPRVEDDARRRLGQHVHQGDSEHLAVWDAAQETDRCHTRETLVPTGEDAQRVDAADVPAEEPRNLGTRDLRPDRVQRTGGKLELAADRDFATRGLHFYFRDWR